MQGRSKYDGFSVLWSVLAVVVVLAIGCIGWLVYHQGSVPTTDKTNTHKTQPQTKPQTKPTNEFVIPEFNVKMTLSDDLMKSNLTYVIDRSVQGAVFAKFTTKALLDLDSGCTAQEGAIGIIAQTPDDPKLAAEQKIGNYFYAFHSPQGSCTGGSLEQTQTAALKQAFATIAANN